MSEYRYIVQEYKDAFENAYTQKEAPILYQSNSLEDIRRLVGEYFKYENYYNSVYFTDTKLNKSQYLGRDFTIAYMTLEEYCGEPPHQSTILELVEKDSNEIRNKLNEVIAYVNELEEQIKELRQTNYGLQSRVNRLEMDIRRLVQNVS